MKTLISENGAYKLYAEIVEPVRDMGKVQLKFTSQWTDAKNPNEFQTKFEAILSKEELGRLRDLL